MRLARVQEEQNNVEWIPKGFEHAHSVSGSIQHCFAPLQPPRGRQEELHTKFASWMETKVVVATTWLPVGIGLNYPYFLTTMETSTPACTATHVRGTCGAATEVKKALLVTYKWSL